MFSLNYVGRSVRYLCSYSCRAFTCSIMREAEVKVELSDGRSVLRKWEKPCQTDLSKITETVKEVKQSVNEYLTELIESSSKEQVELSDASDEEEEAECDGVSGFIKGMTVVKEKSNTHQKRKSNNFNQAKKRKR